MMRYATNRFVIPWKRFSIWFVFGGCRIGAGNYFKKNINNNIETSFICLFYLFLQ